jgi:1-acyl-sn-glycerol-3-phosphate acyltransferase
MQQWLAGLWYEVVSWAAAAGSILGFSARFEGGQHIPPKGSVLLLANHQCYLDPAFVGLATQRRLCFLARKSLWRNKALGWLIGSLNSYPVDLVGVATEGIRAVINLLGEGKAVLVFPEGQRTMNGQMNPLKPGVHLIIRRSLPLIVPVGIAGAYDAWPRWRSYPIPAPLFLPPGKGTIAVAVGRPIDSRPFAEMPREQALAELQKEIHALWQRAERLRRK